MIAFLMGLGLGKRAAQAVAFVVIPLLILGAFYLALDAYGDSRFEAGEAKADKAWHDAAVKLQQQSDDAAADADVGAGEREAAYADKLAEEKEKIDATIADGGDPFDVLFPGGM